MAPNNGFTVWLTGMSGTGKTTIANYIAARLRQVNRNVEILDESDVANDLWKGIGDTKDDRGVTVKRLGYVANLLSRNNVAVLVAAVSPYKPDREANRRVIGRYVEVYVDCPTDKLIERDTTGKYKKALNGEIPNFIGITEPYEPPNSPEVTVHSDTEAVEAGALKVFQALLDLGYMNTEELKVITGTKMKAQPLPKKGARREAEKPAPASKSSARPAARTARPAPSKPAAKKAGKKK